MRPDFLFPLFVDEHTSRTRPDLLRLDALEPPTPVDRVPEMQLVQTAHDRQVLFTLRASLLVEAAP